MQGGVERGIMMERWLWFLILHVMFLLLMTHVRKKMRVSDESHPDVKAEANVVAADPLVVVAAGLPSIARVPGDSEATNPSTPPFSSPTTLSGCSRSKLVFAMLALRTCCTSRGGTSVIAGAKFFAVLPKCIFCVQAIFRRPSGAS